MIALYDSRCLRYRHSLTIQPSRAPFQPRRLVQDKAHSQDFEMGGQPQKVFNKSPTFFDISNKL